VVKKSLELKKKDDKIRKEAESLFQTKRSHSRRIAPTPHEKPLKKQSH
jgi:hypothetical protein